MHERACTYVDPWENYGFDTNLNFASAFSLQGTLAEHIGFGKMGFFEITLNDVLALPFRGIFVATLGMVRTLSCLLDSCHHLPYTTSKVAPSSCESFFTVH